MLLGTKLQSLKACMVTQRSITVTQRGRRGERADRRQAQQDQSRNVPRGEKQLTLFNQLSYRQSRCAAAGPTAVPIRQKKSHILGFSENDWT